MTIAPEMLARLELFAAIEGGSRYWSNEIDIHGPVMVRDRIRADMYAPDQHSSKRIAERLRALAGEGVLAEIERADAQFITPESEDWPEQLNDLGAIPIGLIIKGHRENLGYLNHSISIVGTRNPTNYGATIASDFAAGFVDRDWAVISGGAYGIDAAAHRGALLAEGVTCAVLAGGISKNYPSGHERLFEEITHDGILISEVMPKVPAIPVRFLTRNRIIAALSKGTVVVEAAFRSGSLRTARDAAEIFRPVMAVPGPINSPTSEGCHRLVGERLAELVTSVPDILELVIPMATE
jgi:DNA protecting protein DprA